MANLTDIFKEEVTRYSKAQAIVAMMKKLNISEEDAMEILDIAPTDRQLYSESVEEIRQGTSAFV